jgi:hypothetical protein
MGGQRFQKLLFSVASDLEAYRLVDVTKSAGSAAYSTYGSSPDGWIDARAENLRAGVIPIDQLYGNMILKAQIAFGVRGAAAFCGANGQVVPPTVALAACISKNVLTAPTGTQGDVYIVPATAAGWSTAVAGQIATKGAGAWAYANATAGLVAYVVDEKRYYVCSDTNTWVEAKIVGYANETCSAGEEIEIYNLKARQRVAAEQLPTDSNFKIVLAGFSASETDGDATVTITDERILSTDIAICTALAGATPANCQINLAVCTANTLTITLAGNGGAGTIIQYLIVRAI